MSGPVTFVLPPELSAKELPERRGIRRDQVRLMVIDRATRKTEHTRFDKVDNYLRPGDLPVFNSSRTLPASMRGCECSESHGPCAERLPEELTGLHEPQASHLNLLSAFLPSEQICAAYEEALARKISLARIRRSEPHSLGTSPREVQTGRACSVRPSVSLAADNVMQPPLWRPERASPAWIASGLARSYTRAL